MASEEAPYTVSQNDGLFLHPALTAPTYRTFQRSYHLYVHHGENMEDFVLLAPLMKFLVRLTVPFILTWAMFGTVRLYAQY